MSHTLYIYKNRLKFVLILSFIYIYIYLLYNMRTYSLSNNYNIKFQYGFIF